MTKDDKKSKKLKKSDRLPKHWSYQRRILNEFLLESEGYKESVKKGLPFFTLDELADLERKYKSGISWNEIDAELSKKGMIFKKATFRKYIQERKAPPSKGYRATKKGREAIYPSDTIEHINFIQYYYRVADNVMIDTFQEAFSEQTINSRDAIEKHLGSQNLREGVFTYLRDMSSADDDIQQAIYDILNYDPDFLQKVEDGLGEIYDAFHDKFSDWVKMLEEYEIPISKNK